MPDEMETMLAGLEKRLKDLQAEVGSEPAIEHPQPEVEPLERFGEELRRLVGSFDRALAEARGLPVGEGIAFRGDVALEADIDLRGLCALEQALSSIAGVSSIDLRAYAGAHASLDVVLDRPLALVEELRRALRVPFSVVEAREGRLAIEAR